MFLIRPDGYVGWAGDAPEGLAEYTARVGAGRAEDLRSVPAPETGSRDRVR